jgi:hypothetical protein
MIDGVPLRLVYVWNREFGIEVEKKNSVPGAWGAAWNGTGIRKIRECWLACLQASG